MAAGYGRPPSTQRIGVGAGTVTLALVAAAAAGAAVPFAPVVAGLALVAFACILRFGAITVLLHALVLSMFFESIAVEEVRVGRILAVVALIVLIGRFIGGWRPGPGPLLVWLPAVLFAAWAWASGLWAVSSGAWQEAVGALGLAAAYFLAFATMVDSPGQIRQLLRTFVLGALVMSFVAVAQAGVDVRSVGFQGDPNIFALYQVAAIPAAGMLARTTTSRWMRWAWPLVIFPLMASVLAAQSRGGLLTLAVVLPVAFARGDFFRASRRLVVSGVVAATALVVLIGAFAQRIDERLTLERILEGGGTGRLDIWRTAWQAFLREPLLGLGAGGFEAQSSHLLETTPGVELSPFSIILRTGIRVHNVYLETLTELGPLGLFLWLAILVGTATVLLRLSGLVADASPTSPLLTMLLAFVVATVFLSVTNSKLLWMIVGLAAAAASARYIRDPEPYVATSKESVWSPPDGSPARRQKAGIAQRRPSGGSVTYSAPAAPARRGSSWPYPEGYAPGPVRD